MLQLLRIILLLATYFVDHCQCGKVRVIIYDHRAHHDPIELYGRGPWKYFGHGYGVDYGYDHDGSHSHERGYGFVNAFGREFCKYGAKCRPPDPNFWALTALESNGFSPEPYYAAFMPSDAQHQPKSPVINFIPDNEKVWSQYFLKRK